MQPGLVNTHDLFIGIVSPLMLLIYILILKAVDPVCKYTVIGLWQKPAFLLILSGVVMSCCIWQI